MKLKGLIAEDFCNYKLPSMFLITAKCDWKCCIEQGIDKGVCQNSPLASQETKDVSYESIYNSYVSNPITKAIVIGGLEPMLQYEEMLGLVSFFRENGCNDDFVIYTGYYKNELQLTELQKFNNVVIKFGRFIPNHKPHYDDIIGIYLASDNQYAERIS